MAATMKGHKPFEVEIWEYHEGKPSCRLAFFLRPDGKVGAKLGQPRQEAIRDLQDFLKFYWAPHIKPKDWLLHLPKRLHGMTSAVPVGLGWEEVYHHDPAHEQDADDHMRSLGAEVAEGEPGWHEHEQPLQPIGDDVASLYDRMVVRQIEQERQAKQTPGKVP